VHSLTSLPVKNERQAADLVFLPDNYSMKPQRSANEVRNSNKKGDTFGGWLISSLLEHTYSKSLGKSKVMI
jgi:hypothetical protein